MTKPTTRSPRSRSRPPRYRHPVPEPDQIIVTLERLGVPVDHDALADEFDLTTAEHRRSLRRRVQQMASTGQLIVNRRGEICLTARIEAITGTVSAVRDGSGIVITDDGSPDVVLAPEQMRQVFDGDRVAVRAEGEAPRGRRSGSLLEIVERGRGTLVGRYHRDAGVGYVSEATRGGRHFVVPDRHRTGARDGQFVKAEIARYPEGDREGMAKIIAILGNPADDPTVATDAAIEMYGLPTAWPAPVRRAAERWGGDVRAEDKRERVDLRSLDLVTIDGADARDFDDAVYAERSGEGWRLLVAIADVSHYVRSGEPLDVEAQRRGTSVYFPDRVVPMLPEELSNGLCSLNPAVDRLCMVCDMHVDSRGEVHRSRFHRGVMRSAARLTYEEVQAARDGEHAAAARLAHLAPRIEALYDVYGALGAARNRRGALELELPETKIDLDDTGRVRHVALRSRVESHRLIEECMIAANVEAGRFLRRRRSPSLYRVHAAPDPDRFDELRLMLQALGLNASAHAGTRTRDLNQVLRALAGRPDYPMLATAVLRTMAQAVYQPANIGHFGLALPVYTHFTSPIRRYPDLLVHRAIGQVLDGVAPDDVEPGLPRLEVLGRVSSDRERRADEAARYAQARYKCAYVQDHVGSVFPGVVSGVTHFGLFVTLRDLNVDGLVHVSALGNDYYHLERGGLRLRGERTGARFALGDAIDVRIERVDVDEAKVDLSPVKDGGPLHAPARHPFRRRRR